MERTLLNLEISENLERESSKQFRVLAGKTEKFFRRAFVVLLSFFCFGVSLGNNLCGLKFPKGYELTASKLITYKDENFKVFFGGPIVRPDVALWICPVVFEDAALNVKSVYDVVFVNCNPSQAKNAKVYYIEARDIVKV